MIIIMIHDDDDDDDDGQVDRDEEEQREEREEREMILTTVQLRRASVMDTLVPQVTFRPVLGIRFKLADIGWFQGLGVKGCQGVVGL